MSRVGSRSNLSARRRLDELANEIKAIANNTYMEITKSSSSQFQTDSQLPSAYSTARQIDNHEQFNTINPTTMISPNSQRHDISQVQSFRQYEQPATVANMNSSPYNSVPVSEHIQHTERRTPTSQTARPIEFITNTGANTARNPGMVGNLTKLHAKVDEIIRKSPAQPKVVVNQSFGLKENVAPTPSFNPSTSRQNFQEAAKDAALSNRFTPQKFQQENPLQNIKTHIHYSASSKLNGNGHTGSEKKPLTNVEQNSHRSVHMSNIDQENQYSSAKKIPSTVMGSHAMHQSSVIPKTSEKKVPYDKDKLNKIMQNINRRKDSQSFTMNSAGKSMSDIHSRSNVEFGMARPEYGNRAEML